MARSADGGETYAFAAVPAPGRQIWALAVDPFDPTRSWPAAARRRVPQRRRRGTWSALATGVAEAASIGHTRVTSIRHTEIPGEIWVSVEIGGLLHSPDGGDTWEKVHTEGGRVLLGPDEVWTDERHFDMHDVAVGQTADGRPALFAATPIGFFASEDGGTSWRCTRYPVDGAYEASLFYSRSLHVHPSAAGHRALRRGAAATGPRLARRHPAQRRRRADLASGEPGTALGGMEDGRSPGQPCLVVAVTLFGQVLLSADGGEHWQPADREFGEIRGVCVTGA